MRTEIALYEFARAYRSVILLYRFDFMHGMRRATKISCEYWSSELSPACLEPPQGGDCGVDTRIECLQL